jgi:Winged helix DNA-binding domain
MTLSNIVQSRLHNQQISRHAFENPGDLVRLLGAVQAQDYAASKWAIDLRLRGATDTDIEKAINDITIIRTWALRGTLHFISAPDVRWILKLIAPRLISIYGSHFRKFELDKTVLKKSQKTMVRALKGDKQLTRMEIKAALEKEGISTKDLRANFILLKAALDGIICFGPRRGKEFTFVLLDEWFPATKNLDRDEALAVLTRRYFESHGPATLQDFTWWSGLTVADARKGLDMVMSDFLSDPLKGQTYWMSPQTATLKTKSKSVFLLPNFDEYLVAYRDRTAATNERYFKQIMKSGNGIFSPVIIINGKIAGVWRRSFKKNKVLIETNLFTPLNDPLKAAVAAASRRYIKFLNMKIS